MPSFVALQDLALGNPCVADFLLSPDGAKILSH
jgi:hypothetical protein